MVFTDNFYLFWGVFLNYGFRKDFFLLMLTFFLIVFVLFQRQLKWSSCFYVQTFAVTHVVKIETHLKNEPL